MNASSVSVGAKGIAATGPVAIGLFWFVVLPGVVFCVVVALLFLFAPTVLAEQMKAIAPGLRSIRVSMTLDGSVTQFDDTILFFLPGPTNGGDYDPEVLDSIENYLCAVGGGFSRWKSDGAVHPRDQKRSNFSGVFFLVSHDPDAERALDFDTEKIRKFIETETGSRIPFYAVRFGGS